MQHQHTEKTNQLRSKRTNIDNQLSYPQTKKNTFGALHNMWKTDWLVVDYILLNQDSTPKKGGIRVYT